MHAGKIPVAATPDASTAETTTPDRDATRHAWPAGLDPAARRTKQLLTLRVDPDVLAWFRAQGPGYQTHMTAVLRAYVAHMRDEHAGRDCTRG